MQFYFEEITDSSGVPSARVGSSAVSFKVHERSIAKYGMGEGILLFGGATMEEALNDMHVYNYEKKLWRKIQTKGKIPSARYNHSCELWSDQNGVVLFGGSSNESLFNDMFFYEIGNNFHFYTQRNKNGTLLIQKEHLLAQEQCMVAVLWSEIFMYLVVHHKGANL